MTLPPSGTILQADVIEGLRALPEASVHCVVTSPPYWGLRDYGVAGQLGTERTPWEFVDRLVAVFDEVRRLLRTDGTLWLVLGDSYATGAGSCRSPGGKHFGKQNNVVAAGAYPRTQPNRMRIEGLKPKDLVGVPWMVAFALRNAGWYLRQEHIWHKPNCRPESVRDRATTAHERVFLLSKGRRYYYDYAAVEVPIVDSARRRRAQDPARARRATYHVKRDRPFGQKPWGKTSAMRTAEGRARLAQKGTRGLRTVWTVPLRPNKEAHFAMFPAGVVEPCVLAGCPEGGIVLDPFFGAGTTGLVARQHGRKYIGVELNPDYAGLAMSRLE